jgi:glycine cleavage system H protein
MDPQDRRYTKEHEWILVEGEGDRARVGITDYAQKQLGDVVYVDLPAVGRKLAAHEVFGSVESVKAVSELFAPLSGEVVEVNAALSGTPETINQDPYGAAWMLVLKLSDPSQVEALLDAGAYRAYVESEAK